MSEHESATLICYKYDDAFQHSSQILWPKLFTIDDRLHELCNSFKSVLGFCMEVEQ